MEKGLLDIYKHGKYPFITKDDETLVVELSKEIERLTKENIDLLNKIVNLMTDKKL